MLSRYSLMSESIVQDTKTKESYPDPLSIDNNITLSEAPLQMEIDDTLIIMPYVRIGKIYQQTDAELDDIILNYNNIKYKGEMSLSDKFYIPIALDIKTYIDKYRRVLS